MYHNGKNMCYHCFACSHLRAAPCLAPSFTLLAWYGTETAGMRYTMFGAAPCQLEKAAFRSPRLRSRDSSYTIVLAGTD